MVASAVLSACLSSLTGFALCPFNLVPAFQYILYLLIFGMTARLTGRISSAMLYTAILSYMVLALYVFAGVPASGLALIITNCTIFTISWIALFYWELSHRPKR